MSQVNNYNERIINGAAELFRAHGIRAVTMDTIAGHLGISKRTIYERFSDKDELLFAVMETMIAKHRQKIEDVLKSSPNVIAAIFSIARTDRDHAAASNPVILEDLRKYHSAVLTRLKSRRKNPDYENAARILTKGIEEGHFRSDLNVEIVSRTFAGLGTLTGDDNIFPSDMFDRRDLMKNILVNYLRGISTKEGNKIIDELETDLY